MEWLRVVNISNLYDVMIVMLMIILPQLVSKPQYSLVEKIKTIGSAYMVAAGLTPQVEDTCLEVIAVEIFQGFMPFISDFI